MQEENLDINSLELSLDDAPIKCEVNPLKIIQKTWKYVKEQRLKLLTVCISVVLYTVLSIAAPFYSAIIVDMIWQNIKLSVASGSIFTVSWSNVGAEIFLLMVIYLSAWGFFTLQNFLMTNFSEKLSLRLRCAISEKLNKVPLSYMDKRKVGSVLSYATNDLDKVSETMQVGLLKLVSALGLIVGSVSIMFVYNWGLALIFVGFAFISLIATNFFTKKTMKYASKRQECMSEVTGLVEEGFSGHAVIKAYNQEKNSIERFQKVTAEFAKASQKTDFLIEGINPAIRLINRLGQVCIAVFAGNLLITGQLSPGVVQAFFQYVHQASEPLTEASYMLNSLQSAFASLDRIYSMLEEPEVAKDPDSPLKIIDESGEIEFQNVHFGYTKDNILMERVSFVAQPGQKIAIVGSTGAGKTTLINLLMRFYEISGGLILLDGQDISQMTYGDLRGVFGMVLQDTWLFDGTIADNIAYGKKDATREEIISAAKAARVDFFIRTMPKGYDTVLTNEADNISVGQRQLLTIARVFLCDPSVLILDEATSSVDTRTEMEINKAMRALMKNRTCFVIAHRLSTIVDADLILVMSQGNIIEQGNHAQLLSTKGAYYELYNSQFAAN